MAAPSCSKCHLTMREVKTTKKYVKYECPEECGNTLTIQKKKDPVFEKPKPATLFSQTLPPPKEPDLFS